MAAVVYRMAFDVIWMFYHFQRASEMPRLSAAFLTALVS